MNNIKIDKSQIPLFLVHQYEGGKHWPETGNYDEWLEKQLKSFGEHYVVIGHETYSTYTGGTILLVDAAKKTDLEALLAGTICPDCGWGSATGEKKPDDVAIHLVDWHRYDPEIARVWLRGKIEEKAFHEEA